MLVRNRMSPEVFTVEPQHTIAEARQLLQRRRIYHLPVIRKQRLVGIVTDRDVRSAPAKAKSVADIMTAKPVVIAADASVDEAARLMRKHRIGALPVVDGSKVVGILSASDVLDAFVDVSGVADASYRLMLQGVRGKDGERQVRDLIHGIHGELKWLQRDSSDAARLHLRVKVRDIEDVVTKLEATGIEVCAVVTQARPR